MIRARSRFFFITFSLCWTFLIAFLDSVILARPNPLASDRWRDNESLVHGLLTFSSILAVVTALATSILLAIEWRIHRGWEPHWLEVYRPGCSILEVEPLPLGKANLVVRLPNGEVQTYEADEEETKEVQVGSTSHLWVIGRYISRIQLISPRNNAQSVQIWEWTLIRPNEKPGLTWFFIVFFSALSSYLVAYGLVLAFGGSLIVPAIGGDENGRPYVDLYEGQWVSFTGVTFAFVGLAIFAWLVYQWKRGWDDTFFVDMDGEGRTGPHWS